MMIHRKGLEDHLYIYGLKPNDNIKGYAVTYKEFDNMLSLLRNEGWSGLIGADEALDTIIESNDLLKEEIRGLEEENQELLGVRLRE